MRSGWQQIKCLVTFHFFYTTWKRQLTIAFTGLYEFVKKGDAPVVGITKLEGVTLEELKKPRREAPAGSIPTGVTDEAPSSASSTATAPGA